MNDVARPAGAGKPQMDEIERCGMIDSLQCSREEPTQYEAPESGDKMRALYVIALMDLSNGAKAVAAALVWHANSRTGRCDPGLQRLAYETNRSRQTVINAIHELRRKGVLSKKRRGQSTNAYHINWPVLGGKFREFESRVTQVTFLKRGYKNLDLGGTEPCTSEVKKPVPEPIKRTHEGNPCPERVLSGESTYVSSFPKEKEGIQGKPVEGLPTNYQRPAEPDVYTLINLNVERTEEAAASVDADLSRHRNYQALLGWPELESHLSDAAAAELREKGSGARLILARYAERKATGT
jgi:DNA-binding transcriptional MocR family regulator